MAQAYHASMRDAEPVPRQSFATGKNFSRGRIPTESFSSRSFLFEKIDKNQ